MAVMAAQVPVAEAEAVSPPAGAPAAAQPAVQEVRAAQAAGVSAAVQTERSEMALPKPPPIRF